MKKSDYEYREVHTVVPQLDFSASTDPFSLFEKTEVEHTIYASMENAKVMSKSIAAGLGMGMLKTGAGLAAVGAGAGTYMSLDIVGKGITAVSSAAAKALENRDTCGSVVEIMREEEERAWPKLNFMRTFQPAEGYLGDIILEKPALIFDYEGNGHQFFDNGNYFEGYFKNGKPHKGIFIYQDGTRYLGEFDENGSYTGDGLLMQPDGTYYNGFFQDGKETIIGFAVYATCAYSGYWDRGVWHGEAGWLRNVDGACFFGEFRNGKPVE